MRRTALLKKYTLYLNFIFNVSDVVTDEEVAYLANILSLFYLKKKKNNQSDTYGCYTDPGGSFLGGLS
jgi:hypothetical protein